jgi:uncharacterized repeat protein (TIGR03803 family)
MRRTQLFLILPVSAFLALNPWSARAQCTGSCQFITLYTFTGQPDGAGPQASLIKDAAGNLYGTTEAGGTSNLGTVFKLDASGAETILHSFTGAPDGANPKAGLALDAVGNLYGTTAKGGITGGVCAPFGCGVVFQVDATGKETVLYSFMGNPDGWNPLAGLVRDSSGNLFGTTLYGGGVGPGTVFRLDTSGKETVLHSFFNSPTDGAGPEAGVILDGSGNIYGATASGGTLNCTAGGGNTPVRTVGCGTVFKLDSTGAQSVLYTFLGANKGPHGAFPSTSLVRDAEGNLYGTTLEGGNGVCYSIAMLPPQPNSQIYCGTVFKVDPTGKATVLHKFFGDAVTNPRAQKDGASPHGALVLDAAGNLYGTTFYGGTGNCSESGFRSFVHVGCGTIFRVDPAGDETVLYSFTNQTDGAFPDAGLLLDSAGNLYGTTSANGSTAGAGTVFKFTPPNTPTTFTVSITLVGSGSGTVTSNPVGINCGTQCSANFDSGTAITLAAAPATGSTFSGWSGACSGSGSCAVTVSAAESVTATFNTTPPPDFSVNPASANLTVQKGGQVTDVITIAAQNGSFGNPVQLSCAVAGSTPLATCALSFTSVTPGANSAVSTLTITAPGLSAELTPSNEGGPSTPPDAVLLLMQGLVVLGLCAASSKMKQRPRQLCLLCSLFLAFVTLQVGCGGGPPPPPPPTLNYTVTVTATSGAVQHTAQIMVSVP